MVTLAPSHINPAFWNLEFRLEANKAKSLRSLSPFEDLPLLPSLNSPFPTMMQLKEFDRCTTQSHLKFDAGGFLFLDVCGLGDAAPMV